MQVIAQLKKLNISKQEIQNDAGFI
jgi:hypothetical protein